MNTPQLLTVESLAQEIGRDAREIEKLAQKGQIPGRKVDGKWVFQSNEIRSWIESQLKTYSTTELTALEKSQRSEEIDHERPISSLLKLEAIEIPLQAKTKRSVIERLVQLAEKTWQIWNPAEVLQAVLDREEAMSTSMPGGVAIPHLRTPLPDALGESVVAFGCTGNGIPFGGSRELPDLFFLILCRDTRTHLQVLARLGRLFLIPNFLDQLRAAETAEQAWQFIADAEQSLN